MFVFDINHRHRRNGVPGLKILSTMLRWFWPAERCANCQSIYSITKPSDMLNKNIDEIKRSNDGRFVITYGSDIDIYRPTSATTDISNSSESDDGGFLPQRKSKLRTSWRRPLVSCPSELSFSPIVQTSRRASHDGLLHIGNNNNKQPLLQIVPIEHHPIPPTYQNIDSIDRTPAVQHNRNIFMQQTPSTTTTKKLTRIVSSSPAISSPMAINSSTLLSPQTMYFNDLSSVLQSSSRDPSLPTSQHINISQLRMLQERYAQELPSLRAIHEETRRMVQQNAHHQINDQMPLKFLIQSNSSPTSSKEMHIHHMPNYHPHHPYTDHYHNQQPHFDSSALAAVDVHENQQLPLIHQRFKSKLLPRHYRLARSAPELASPNQSYDMNVTLRPFEITPESQSSSSGFGSRNTSQTHPNQTLRTAATISMGQQQNVRNLPPYRPPPKYIYYPYEASSTSQHSSPYTMDHWLDLLKMSDSNYLMADNAGSDAKAVDVCSVDGPYEFDPATPTPTASTPTGLTRDELFLGTPRELVLPHSQFTLLQTQSLQPYQRKRVSKYENIEARVQAMKEEFHAYRKRQAMQMQQHTIATANNATAT